MITNTNAKNKRTPNKRIVIMFMFYTTAGKEYLSRVGFTMQKHLNSKNFLLSAAVMLAATVVLLPLSVDLSYAPKGWELPKVHVLQIVLITLLFVCAVYALYMLAQKRASWTRFDTSMLLTAGLVSVGSIASNVVYNLPAHRMYNPLYRLILNAQEGSYTVSMAIFGNEYRETGLITILLLFGTGWFIARTFNWRHIKILITGFALSALFQATLGLYQLAQIGQHPTRFAEGRLIYGSFGQNNFYAGLLLVGIASCLFLFRSERIQLRVLAIVTALFATAMVFLSLSYFSWIIMIYILVIALFASGKIPGAFSDNTSRLVLVTVLAILPLGLLLISVAPWYKHRLNIWVGITEQYVLGLLGGVSAQSLIRALFGSGFDTLQETLYNVKILDGANVDRAHNIIFDVIAMTGLTGLGLISYFGYKIREWFKRIDSMNFRLLVVILGVWLMRSLIHTSSVVNLFEGVLLAAAVIAAARSSSSLRSHKRGS